MTRLSRRLQNVEIKLFCIDPGIYSMGYAYWHTDDPYEIPIVGLVKSDGKKGLIWNQTAIIQASKLQKLVIPFLPYIKLVLCEWPEYYGQNLVATTNKLCFMVGSVARLFPVHKFQTVTPMQWKGQLKKDVVKRRIIDHYGERECREWKADEWDAVGIGLWKMGVL